MQKARRGSLNIKVEKKTSAVAPVDNHLVDIPADSDDEDSKKCTFYADADYSLKKARVSHGNP